MTGSYGLRVGSLEPLNAMHPQQTIPTEKRLWGRSGLWLILLLVFLGLWFRVAGLADKVYWVDEVATSIRVAGYTRQEVIAHLADGQPRSIDQLQHYQRLNPDKGWADTLHALTASPEHAPLYFLLARGWTQTLGSSVATLRTLSVGLSLLALPCMGALAWELFSSLRVAVLAMGGLAISPFFVAYAQEARPYSLWTVVLLVNGWLLLRAMRCNDWLSWLGYGVSAAVGLYTSLLSGLVLLGQGGYVVWLGRSRPVRRIQPFVLSLSGAMVSFLPWLWIIAQQWSTLQDNTTWSRRALSFLPMMAIWLYNVAVLYFDVPVVVSPVWIGLIEVAIALVVTSLMGFSIYFLCRHTSKAQWLFVVSSIAAIPLWLMGLDLVRGNQLSTAARYMMPSLLGIQLAMAYLISHQIHSVVQSNRKRFWRGIVLLLIALSLISCVFQLYQSPKYQKSRNLHNQPIATILNQANSPLLLAESAQTLDVISLSYGLKPEIEIQIFPEHFFEKQLVEKQSILNFTQCQDVFIFSPSPALQTQMRTQMQTLSRSQSAWTMQAVYQPKQLIADEIILSLWSVIPPRASCSS